MRDLAIVRTVVRPVIGERRWQLVRGAGQDVRRRVARNAKVLQNARQLRRNLAAADAQLARERHRGGQHAADLLSHGADLTWLARHFRTDKWGVHFYTPHYQRALHDRRERALCLLEIGIGGYARSGEGGGSLRMWKHYLPNSAVYGLDIEDKSFVDEPRIRTFRGDQADPQLLHRIVAEIGRPDVVIDDGSHRSEHVIATFEVLFPLLADDGIYAIEDVQTSYWPEWGGAEEPADTGTSMAFCKRLADGLNYEEFVDPDYEPSYFDQHIKAVHFYHNLVIIEKGANREGTRKRAILRKRYEPDVTDRSSTTG
jgi:hypothetical protein